MANATNKATIAEKYDALLALIESANLGDSMVCDVTAKEFIADRKDKAKKSSSAKGAFNLNDEQKSIIDEVKRVLIENGNKPMVITDIQKKSDVLGNFSTSKVTSAVTKMTVNAEKKPNPNGIFTRTVDKKSATYSVVASALVEDTDEGEE